MHTLDKVLLLNDHVTLDDTVKGNENNHVSVEDMTGDLAQQTQHAEERSSLIGW